jgi:type 1 glutamine amidotransferase
MDAMKHDTRRALLLISLLSSTIGLAATANARPAIDCPQRGARYSVDSPLIDVLLKPEAKAAVDREAPTLLLHFPPMFASTTAPAFSAIMTLRLAAVFQGLPESTLAPVNSALASLPITDSDREARCARYDIDRPKIAIPSGAPRLLLFQKITGFRDAPSVEAATRAMQGMAERHGWALVITDKGGSIEPSTLRKFDAVIWNNVSGDVLTLTQRRALKTYIEHGGGFVAFHGSGGDPAYFWEWYVDTLIGARFEGHPMAPQFQDARIAVEDGSGIGHDLAPGWEMKDEWYSFKTTPRAGGVHVIATLDEASYSPTGMNSQDLRMGDHPIAWSKCIRDGRSFYTAIGHLPESYSEPHVVKLLEQAITWAAGGGETRCRAGKEATRGHH